ncbi:MAG: P-type conjugative transfer protein TrbJ [Candidatus Peregrinibacteria bacterium GW2011_GWA2_44_7]|nr:MAG: P-type conjugative transfer protein TrbJ [Candidatus Peregrinibacteria bacterium GW2011_GWA2_44_7]
MSGGATEVTQILNNVQLAESYAQQVMQYQNQLLQYETMIRNLAKNPLGVIAPDLAQMVQGQARLLSMGTDIASSMSKVDLNFSKNFTDPNNDQLRYNFSGILGPITNLSIDINNASGIVNITPSPNYFGSQLIQFFAFDGDNATSSNTINLLVIGVNDIPNASLAVLISSDALNRSNGTLSTSWTYSDIEGDSQAANETLWYLNGTEAALLRNLTQLLS